MNILGLITARGGSKTLPKKNIKLLGGHPLIAYTISVAKRSKILDHVILSTDDEEIAHISKSYGCEVPFMRPKELATDTIGHVPVIQHAIDFMEKKLGNTFDYIVLLQPTSPFRTPEDIDRTVEVLIKNDADSAVSLVSVGDHHPLKAKEFDGQFVKPFFSGYPEPEGVPRQSLPKAYKRSGAVYAMRRDLIMKDGRLYGDKITGHVVPEDWSIDIDNEVDWIIAENMLKKLLDKGIFFIHKEQ